MIGRNNCSIIVLISTRSPSVNSWLTTPCAAMIRIPVTPIAIINACPKLSIDIVVWLLTAASSHEPMVSR